MDLIYYVFFLGLTRHWIVFCSSSLFIVHVFLGFNLLYLFFSFFHPYSSYMCSSMTQLWFLVFLWNVHHICYKIYTKICNIFLSLWSMVIGVWLINFWKYICQIFKTVIIIIMIWNSPKSVNCNNYYYVEIHQICKSFKLFFSYHSLFWVMLL